MMAYFLQLLLQRTAHMVTTLLNFICTLVFNLLVRYHIFFNKGNLVCPSLLTSSANCVSQ